MNTNLEDPVVGGGGSQPPGYWAQRVLNHPWPVARCKSFIKRELSQKIKTLPATRELAIRPAKRWDGEKLEKTIGSRRSNLEAAQAQVTGQLLAGEQECGHCYKKKGPFEGCVVVPLPSRISRRCANCHFSEMHKRCSLGKPRTMGEANPLLVDATTANATIADAQNSDEAQETPESTLANDTEKKSLTSLKLAATVLDNEITALADMLEVAKASRQSLQKIMEDIEDGNGSGQ